jgi:hypothetical protein
MTETTLKVQLSELTTLRIICRNNGCGGVIEIPTAKLINLSRIHSPKCPLCQHDLLASGYDTFVDLGMMIDRIKALDHTFSLEFPVHLDDAQRDGKHD